MYKKLLWGVHSPRESSDKHTDLITVFKAYYSTGLCIKKLFRAQTAKGRILKQENVRSKCLINSKKVEVKISNSYHFISYQAKGYKTFNGRNL